MMQQEFFGIQQLLPAFVWMVIIFIIAQIQRSKYGKEEGRFFMYNVLAKLFFSLCFALFYILSVKGGDTIAYFNSSMALTNLLYEDPGLYFDQMISTPTNTSMLNYFNFRTGFPPGWIYREPESFFVSKILSIVTLITFKSFIASTFLVSYFVASSSYRVYAMIRKMNFVPEQYLAVALLFLPSVNFWCTGFSKDSLVMIGVFMLIYHGIKLISSTSKRKLRSIIILGLMSLMLFHIREVVLYATVLSLVFAYSAWIGKRISKGRQGIIFVRFVIISVGFFAISQSLTGSSEEEFLAENQIFDEAATTQRDFSTNELYGEKRYSLGEIEYTPVGLIRAAPMAMVAGILRPFPWESLSASLLFSGLESLILIYLLIRFLGKNLRAKFRLIQGQEVLLFALTFVLVISFVTGLTSGLFGVLVRLRAPLLPFAFILLAVQPILQNKIENLKESPT